MKDLHRKTAVVTGGASGIGRAMARSLASEGMRLAIGDIEERALAEAVTDLEASGAEAIGVPVDVSKMEDVEALRDAALEKFGAVHVVCNNAGVGSGGPIWQSTVEDWQWVLGVNLWGVIHGVLAFVPALVEQNEGHVVNTASMAGLVTGPGLGIYAASKFAVVAITETLAHDLDATGSKVHASVLCPGWVKTGIAESERNRPPELSRTIELDAAGQAMAEFVRQVIDSGTDPAVVGDLVAEAIKEERFYILPHPEMVGGAKKRVDRLLAALPPELDIAAWLPAEHQNRLPDIEQA